MEAVAVYAWGYRVTELPEDFDIDMEEDLNEKTLPKHVALLIVGSYNVDGDEYVPEDYAFVMRDEIFYGFSDCVNKHSRPRSYSQVDAKDLKKVAKKYGFEVEEEPGYILGACVQL